MIGYWYALNVFDIYVNITEKNIKLTIPAYDVFNKQCSRFNITGNSCCFNYNECFYKLIANKKENLFFKETNIITKQEKVIAFKKISENEYKRNSEPIDRVSLLSGCYKKTAKIDIRYKYNFNNSELKRLKDKAAINNWVDLTDELSTVYSILKWINMNIKHNGNICLPDVRTANNLLSAAENNGNFLNCRGLAILASELCLSMGLFSRFIVCMQKEVNICNCHVVVIVYIKKYKKWVMADPSYNAVLYSKNELLSIEEIRNCLSNDIILTLNDTANYYGKKLSYDLYIKSLKKNFYRFSTPIEMYPGCDKKNNLIDLVPNCNDYNYLNCTDNPQSYWKLPEN